MHRCPRHPPHQVRCKRSGLVCGNVGSAKHVNRSEVAASGEQGVDLLPRQLTNRVVREVVRWTDNDAVEHSCVGGDKSGGIREVVIGVDRVCDEGEFYERILFERQAGLKFTAEGECIYR